MEFIHDFLWLWVFGAVGGTSYILWALFIRGAPLPARSRSGPQAVTTRRTPAAPPVARPAGAAPPARTPVTPAAPAVVPPTGSPEYQRRGSAPTVKLPTTDSARPAKSADDDAAADLFSGLGPAKPKTESEPPRAPAKDVVDKAGRIEEYGFHVGTKAANESDARQADAAAAAAVAKPEPATAIPEVPGQSRSQTQELDDILKRIDAVLSETGAPASEATMATPQQGSSGEQTLPVPTQPPQTAKIDRTQTDPNQQKLF